MGGQAEVRPHPAQLTQVDLQQVIQRTAVVARPVEAGRHLGQAAEARRGRAADRALQRRETGSRPPQVVRQRSHNASGHSPSSLSDLNASGRTEGAGAQREQDTSMHAISPPPCGAQAMAGLMRPKRSVRPRNYTLV
ncbi:hypothetical protein GCM10009416_41050 [Craurococcus roseus]|uniref:Uncharacterized protein n=1 Tax=Craurococcus roseus TaxID=77585 RepID=A0ABP3QW48_9PROT